MALGIFLAIANGVTRLAGDIYENHSNEQAKEWTRKNYPDSPTYMDCYGKTKLIANDHPTLSKTLPNGDNVLIDTKTWKQVYNYSEERRKKEAAGMTKQQIAWRNKAIANGERFCTFDVGKYGCKDSYPRRYQDLQTGKICNMRFYNGIWYYTDLDGKYIDLKPNMQIKKYLLPYIDVIIKNPTIGEIR